jgi:hypothetical protein
MTTFVKRHLVKGGLNLAGAAALVLGAAWMVDTTRPAAAQDFDVNAVFYCEGKPIGEQSQAECEQARTAFFANCTVCHSFVVTVKAQKDLEGWQAFMNQHSGRVPDLAEADRTLITNFLAAHFNPENPPPQLPPELEALSDLPPA